MRNLYLFPFVLLFSIIKNNLGKIILSTITFLCFYCANEYFYEDQTTYRQIVHKFERNGNYIYMYENISDSKVNYESIVTNKPLVLKNNIYYYTETQGLYIFLVIVGGILGIVLFVVLITSITGDDSTSWDLDECFSETFSFFIVCEIENNKFYYMIFGRLIKESATQLSPYRNMADELYIRSFTNVYNCPKFKTKKQNRNSVLSDLGIK